MRKGSNNKKASYSVAGYRINRNNNYINLLIIKPFKAGATEPKSFLIPIDS
tara:strand:+ start:309 stop:461 length:153 start_codon:yes stop_codon:yes gene_type:complete